MDRSLKLLTHYLKSLLVFVIAAWVIYYFMDGFFINSGYAMQKPWGLFMFFTAMILAFHIGLIYMGTVDDKAFVKYFMAASVIKILICILVFILFAVAKPMETKAFAMRFILLYALFMIFEIFYLQKNSALLRNKED
jgi:hypothetical protein